jgi:Tfp pilus assembly protein PilN
MLRTNLATRPFYNDRAVRLGLAAAAVLIAALSGFNVLQVLSLNARNGEMTVRAQQAEAETAKFRQQARAITQAMDKAEVTAVQEASHEANLLIERRAFSWTELFNRFESTLPADVRISAVEPQSDREGRLVLNVSVISRRVEDLHAFMDQLEGAGGLSDVISRQDDRLEDGTQRSVIQGYYDAKAGKAADSSSPASDPNETAGNASPQAPNASPSMPQAPTGPQAPGVRKDSR